MNASLAFLRKAALALTLTIAALAVTSHVAPATHAATQPHISASLISNTEFLVAGQGFSSGGYVDVFVHNSHGRLIQTVSVRATIHHCTPTMCQVGGYFDVYIHVVDNAETDYTIARDVRTGLWSNVTSA